MYIGKSGTAHSDAPYVHGTSNVAPVDIDELSVVVYGPVSTGLDVARTRDRDTRHGYVPRPPETPLHTLHGVDGPTYVVVLHDQGDCRGGMKSGSGPDTRSVRRESRPIGGEEWRT